MSEVDPLILKLVADVNDYNSKVSQAQRLTDQRLGAIESRSLRMGNSVRKGFNLAQGAAAAFVAGVGLQGLSSTIQKGLDYAAALNKQAQLANASVEQFQRAAYAASTVGIQSEKLADIYKDVNDRIGDFIQTGGGEMADFFTKIAPKIGVTAEQFRKLSGPDALQLYYTSLEKAGLNQQDMTFYMESMADEATALIPLLRENGAGMKALAADAERLGVVLSAETIAKAGEASKKLAALNNVLRANVSTAVTENAGAIITLSNALTGLVVWLGKAAQAYTRFQLARGEMMADVEAKRPFASDQERAAARAQASRYRAAIAQMDGTQDKTGAFRDYRAAPIPGYKPGEDNSRPAGLDSSPPAKGSKTGAGGGGGAASGPSARDLDERMNSQIASYASQALSAMQSQARSADERAELELRGVESARFRALAEVDADKELGSARQRRVREAIEVAVFEERAAIEFRRKVETEREATDLASETYQSQSDALRAQLELTDSNDARRKIAFELLGLELRHRKALLESVIASETASKHDKERAQITLNGLEATAPSRAAATADEYAGPGERYLKDLNREAENLSNAYENIAVNSLEKMNQGFADAARSALGLHGVLGDIIGDLIEIAFRQNVIGPLASAIFGGGPLFGGGGFNAGSLTAMTNTAIDTGIRNLSGARANGGPVGSGRSYLVGERGPEILRMGSQSGHVIPNELIRANAPARGATATVRLELSGDIDARIVDRAHGVAVQVVRASAPAVAASSAQLGAKQGEKQVFHRMSRRLPG